MVNSVYVTPLFGGPVLGVLTVYTYITFIFLSSFPNNISISFPNYFLFIILRISKIKKLGTHVKL